MPPVKVPAMSVEMASIYVVAVDEHGKRGTPSYLVVTTERATAIL
jgi:hypothetical protein